MDQYTDPGSGGFCVLGARTSGRWEDPSALSALSAAVGRADNADKADKGLRAICTKRPGDLYNSVGESTLKRSFCLNHRSR